MSRKSKRRAPQQDRAKATVDAIIEATAQLLVEEGFHKTSTNRIAERAGVSVGSLYQYFKNKEAIVSALLERFAEEQFQFLAERLSEFEDTDLEEGVRRLVETLLEAKELNPELNKVFFEELPPIGQVDVLRDWTDQAVAVVSAALELRRDEIAMKNLDVAAYVLVNACHGIIHNTVVYRPQLLRDDALAEETTRMILGYLRADLGK